MSKKGDISWEINYEHDASPGQKLLETFRDEFEARARYKVLTSNRQCTECTLTKVVVKLRWSCAKRLYNDG